MKTEKKKAAGRKPKAADKSEHKQSTTECTSVKERMLTAFRSGRKLTHLDVWHEFGSSRASHHVYALRKDGWPIITESQKVKTSDHGRMAIIARYRIPPEHLDKGAR